MATGTIPPLKVRKDGVRNQGALPTINFRKGQWTPRRKGGFQLVLEQYGNVSRPSPLRNLDLEPDTITTMNSVESRYPEENVMTTLETYIVPEYREDVRALLAQHPEVVVPLRRAIRDIEAYAGVTGIVLEADIEYGGPPIVLGVSTDLDIDDVLDSESRFWDDPAHHPIFEVVLVTMDR